MTSFFYPKRTEVITAAKAVNVCVNETVSAHFRFDGGLCVTPPSDDDVVRLGFPRSRDEREGEMEVMTPSSFEHDVRTTVYAQPCVVEVKVTRSVHVHVTH